MFDQEGDAMSVYSASSRMPSLVMEPGMSMQDYYLALQAKAHELNAENAIRTGEAAAAHSKKSDNLDANGRPRRNSGSSIMSDTERLYGWSGSRGGISNQQQGPRYRLDKDGKLVLHFDEQQQDKAANAQQPLQNSSNPAALLGANSNGRANGSKPASNKPMYRPAFAPSAQLPQSDDEVDEDDRVIQHDLPTTRPLKPRASLKQKLGSVLARVGSVRRGGASSPPASGEGSTVHRATSPGKTATSPGESGGSSSTSGALDYVSVKRANTAAASYGRKNGRPDFTRKTSALAKETTMEEEEELDTKQAGASSNAAGGLTAPIVTFTPSGDENTPPVAGGSHKAVNRAVVGGGSSSDREDNTYLDAEGGAFTGGFVGLARKLSRRATTGGGNGHRRRSRSLPRNLRDEREKQTDLLADKAAAEEMLKDLAKIPLYKPPRSAHVKNAKPLSSFPPRAALRVTNEHGSLANAPRYSYYQRPLNDARGRTAGPVERANTTAGATGHRSSHNRGRSGSTPSAYSSISSASGVGLANGNAAKVPMTSKEDIPPVPPLPELVKDAPVSSEAGNTKGNWTVFKKDSTTSLNKK